MNLTLTRNISNENGIFGSLTDESGNIIAVTLEHAYDSGNGDGTYSPKLPPGTYGCQRGQHQLASMAKPFITFQIMNVPGHTNILLHQGNYNNDSEGCVLLGTSLYPDDQNPNMIKQSAQAFQKFMSLEDGLDSFTLVVM